MAEFYQMFDVPIQGGGVPDNWQDAGFGTGSPYVPTQATNDDPAILFWTHIGGSGGFALNFGTEGWSILSDSVGVYLTLSSTQKANIQKSFQSLSNRLFPASLYSFLVQNW